MKTCNLQKTIGSIHFRKIKKTTALCIGILFVISIVATPNVHAAPSGVSSIFSSGFEDGLSSWSATYGGVSVVSSPVYSGSYALKCSDPSASRVFRTVGSQVEIYTEAEFYFDRAVAGSETFIAFLNANGNPTVSMGLSVQSGVVYVFVQTSLPSYSYGQYRLAGIASGTWTKLALDASASSAKIYVNDVQVAGVSQASIPATSSVIVGMFYGDGGYSGNLYVDNVQVGSSSDSSSTSTSTPTPTSTPTLVAVSSATASSYYDSNTPNRAIDGIEAIYNYWGTNALVTAGTLPQWLQLDLGTQTNINQITTHFYDGDARTYTYYIQTSIDSSTWTTIVPTKTGSSIVTDTFTQTAARYVKITITGNTANLAAHIEEIKIYQSTNPTPTPTSTPTPTPNPTSTIFSNGFEDGLNSWTSTYGGVSVVSSPVYSGSYALKCSDPSASRVFRTVGSQVEIYTEAEFYFDRAVAGSETFIAFLNANGNPTVSMGLSVQSGVVYVFVQTSLPSYSYGQYRLAGIAPGTWTKLALDASASSAKIYVNDVQVASVSQANIPATASVIVGMFYGDGGYSGNLYIDNVQVGSSSDSSSGPISTPTPTPIPSSTPTPVTTPTPTPTQTFTGNSLPLSALGDDYLIFSNFNGNPSYWTTQTHWFTEYHCNTAKLGMSFADEPAKTCSTYDKNKLATVLSILDAVGVKVILVNQNGNSEAWFGSQAWFNDWKQVARDFAGDTRIKAFEFCGEAYSQFWDNNSPYGAWNLHNFDTACSALISQIRVIDSSRTIMYPLAIGILTTSVDAFYNDLVATGVISQGNLIYDICHPYYFEQYPNLDPVSNPVGDADWYWNAYCLPQIRYFGAANCCAGEYFPWSTAGYVGGNPANGHYNYALQQQFGVAMINHFVSGGMGFQMWCFFSRTDQQDDINVLNSSNYYALIHS